MRKGGVPGKEVKEKRDEKQTRIKKDTWLWRWYQDGIPDVSFLLFSSIVPFFPPQRRFLPLHLLSLLPMLRP